MDAQMDASEPQHSPACKLLAGLIVASAAVPRLAIAMERLFTKSLP
jgi:hypothetical protein